MAKKVTMRDIARELGISVSAVSLALNNRSGVTDDLRQRVARTAKKLGYEFRERNAAVGGSMDIGLILRQDSEVELRSIYFTEIQHEAHREAEDRGFHLLVNFLSCEEMAAGQLPFFMKKDLRGLIVTGAYTTDYLMQLIGKGVPIVSAGNDLTDLGIPSVLSDDVGGAARAVGFLIENGYRRIALISDDPRYSSASSRRAGYLLALSDAGMEHDSRLAPPGRRGAKDEVGCAMTREILASVDGQVDAFFCATDEHAIGCMKALRAAGLKIPEDVAVMGFDDKDYSGHLVPPLTTVHIHSLRMGRLAVRRLIDMIEGRAGDDWEVGVKEIVPVALIERESVAVRAPHHSVMAQG